MTLNTVTLKWDIPDLTQSGLSGTLTITPTAQMSDTTDHELIPSLARAVKFSGGVGQLAGIVANDNSSVLPAGTGYLITVTASNGQVIVPQLQTQILTANGATQWLDTLAPVASVTTAYQYLPLPTGTPTSGQVPVATGTGEASAWTTVTVSGQFLCAPSVYAPGSQTIKGVSSTTMGAVFSTSINTGSFTAPPSGDVVVMASFMSGSANGTFVAFGLAAHGTVTPIIGNENVFEFFTSDVIPVTLRFYVSGLTPGTPYNFDLLAAASTGAINVYAGSQASTTPTLSGSGVGAPVVLTVQAV